MIELAELNMIDVAAVFPKLTTAAPAVKPVPVIVTEVPPATGPALGLIVRDGRRRLVGELIRAAGRRDVPPGAVTVMSTVPDPAGEVAVIEVGELIVNAVAACPVPKLTALASVNPVPCDRYGGAAGRRPGGRVDVRHGRHRLVGELIGAARRGRSARGRDRDVDRPRAAPGRSRDRGRRVDRERRCRGSPNSTVAPVREPVPVIVTVVPPASGPALGLIFVTVGAASKANLSALLVAERAARRRHRDVDRAADCAGEVAVIDVGELTVTPSPRVAPKSTWSRPR